MIATQAVNNVIGGDRYSTVTQELKDYLQGLYGTPPVGADSELRRLVLGREEPITIRPADLLEPQVESARLQLRNVAVEPTDDAVLLQLLFPNLAAAYPRGPEKPAKREPAPEVKTEPAKPAPAAEAPAPAAAPDPPAAATTTAEFEVEVEGEVFKVKVTGAGMAGVAPTAAAAPPPYPPPGPGHA